LAQKLESIHRFLANDRKFCKHGNTPLQYLSMGQELYKKSNEND